MIKIFFQLWLSLTSIPFSYFIVLVIQCRKRDPKSGDTTNDLSFFQKGMEAYKAGFGELGSDFWLGLENLHNLTATETNWRLEVSRNHMFLYYLVKTHLTSYIEYQTFDYRF